MIIHLLIINSLIIFGLLFVNAKNIRFLKKMSLISAFSLFILSCSSYVLFQNDVGFFQHFYEFFWIQYMNIFFALGLDGLSVCFIILATFLIPFCILISWTSIIYRLKEYIILLFIIEWLLINVFAVLDIFLFYIFFEAILIPMFLVIGIWGSRMERVKASYQFFFYTLVGSLFMLLGILCIYSYVGSTDYYLLINTDFSNNRQLFLWLSFFASFAVKIPMFPFHIWLPQAHVEAPTAGSVLLAGILLKLGGYGFLRFSIPMFPYASRFFVPLIFTLSTLAIIFASLTTIRQIDLKRIIAYSSVAHMNYVTLGIFSFNMQGIEGSIFLMLSHGLVSSALFLIVGMLYDRYKTRIIRYFAGFTQLMPLFSIFFLFLTFANTSFPGTSGFIGEMLILLGTFKINIVSTILATLGTIFGAVYSIWLFNRIFFGQLNAAFIHRYSDINRREFFILLPFIVLIIIMGIYPSIFLDVLHLSVTNILVFYY